MYILWLLWKKGEEWDTMRHTETLTKSKSAKGWVKRVLCETEDLDKKYLRFYFAFADTIIIMWRRKRERNWRERKRYSWVKVMLEGNGTLNYWDKWSLYRVKESIWYTWSSQGEVEEKVLRPQGYVGLISSSK